MPANPIVQEARTEFSVHARRIRSIEPAKSVRQPADEAAAAPAGGKTSELVRLGSI
jgi:hypothetical protein